MEEVKFRSLPKPKETRRKKNEKIQEYIDEYYSNSFLIRYFSDEGKEK